MPTSIPVDLLSPLVSRAIGPRGCAVSPLWRSAQSPRSPVGLAATFATSANKEESMLIRDLTPLWRAALAADHAPRTVRSYVDHVRDYLSQLGPEATVTAVTPQSVEAFKRRLAVRSGPKTVALALTAVRSFVRWQIAADLRVDDPTLRVRF